MLDSSGLGSTSLGLAMNVVIGHGVDLQFGMGECIFVGPNGSIDVNLSECPRWSIGGGVSLSIVVSLGAGMGTKCALNRSCNCLLDML